MSSVELSLDTATESFSMGVFPAGQVTQLTPFYSGRFKVVVKDAASGVVVSESQEVDFPAGSVVTSVLYSDNTSGSLLDSYGEASLAPAQEVVEILHACPGLGAVDAYLQASGPAVGADKLLARNLGYLVEASDPSTVVLGASVVAFRPTGAAVKSKPLTLSASPTRRGRDASMTVALAGLGPTMPNATNVPPRALLFEDEWGTLAFGYGAVRLLHLANMQASVLAVVLGSDLVLTPTAIPRFASSGFIPVPAGVYNVSVLDAWNPAISLAAVTVEVLPNEYVTISLAGISASLATATATSTGSSQGPQRRRQNQRGALQFHSPSPLPPSPSSSPTPTPSQTPSPTPSPSVAPSPNTTVSPTPTPPPPSSFPVTGVSFSDRTAPDVALVRVLHTAYALGPGIGNSTVGVWLGSILVGHARYGDATAYLSVPPGVYSVGVSVDGIVVDVAQTGLTVSPDRAYTVLLTGSPVGSGAAIVDLLEDTLTPPPRGSVTLRFVNAARASADGSHPAGPVAVLVNRDSAVEPVAAFKASAYVTLPVQSAATMAFVSPSEPLPVLTGVDLREGTVYTAVLEGVRGGPLDARLIADVSYPGIDYIATARARFLIAVSTNDSFVLYLNGLAAASVTPQKMGVMGQYMAVPGATNVTATLKVVPVLSPAQRPVGSWSPQLVTQPGGSYTIVGSGSEAGITAAILNDTLLPGKPGYAQARVALLDYPQAALGVSAPEVSATLAGVQLPPAGAYVYVKAGSAVQLRLTTSGKAAPPTTTTLYTTVKAGSAYTAVVPRGAPAQSALSEDSSDPGNEAKPGLTFGLWWLIGISAAALVFGVLATLAIIAFIAARKRRLHNADGDYPFTPMNDRK
jgi:hypothetical protein